MTFLYLFSVFAGENIVVTVEMLSEEVPIIIMVKIYISPILPASKVPNEERRRVRRRLVIHELAFSF